MNDSDALYDFDACKAGNYVRCRTVLSNPLENVFDRAGIFAPLAIAGDGCGRMESGAHQIPVPCPGPSDITVHGLGDCVMFDQVSICGWFGLEVLGFIYR